MTQHSSLLASLGAVLHLQMRGGGAGGAAGASAAGGGAGGGGGGVHTSSSLKQRPAPLDAFERSLGSRLHDLETAADAAYFTLPWLQQAMAVVLETHGEVDALVPHLRGHQEVDERWMDDYLDDSAKLLDCCKVLLEGLGELMTYQRLVEVALHALGPGQEQERATEVQAARARAALLDCKDAIRRKEEQQGGGGSSHHHNRSRLDSYSSMLRTMGDRLAAPKPYEAMQGQGFLGAVYGAKVVTIYICGLILAAISFRPRKPLFHIGVNHHPLWSSALLSLIHKVKEETERRRATASHGCSLLQELDNVDTAVTKAHHFLDSLLSHRTSFPLSQEQINDLGKLVEIFGASATELQSGTVALEQQINDLFRSLVTNRITVLDCLTIFSGN